MPTAFTTSPAHTAGPWNVEEATHLFRIIANGETIALTEPRGRTTRKTKEEGANARLMAAAPELLAALRYAYQRLNDVPHNYAQTDFKLVRNALAKVEV